MIRPLLILLLLAPLLGVAEDQELLIEASSMGRDRAYRADFMIDSSGSMGIEEIKTLPDDRFKDIRAERKNFGRPTDPVWIRFQVKNGTDGTKRFLLGCSRSMTNRVDLFRVERGYLLDSMTSGDHIPYAERPFPHRRPLFPIELGPQEKASFFLRMKGEGATLILSLKVWSRDAFQSFDQKERLFLGLFYGFLIFVTLIFSFFYFELKERSFLFYFLYVISFALLLFTLDGFSYRFFFPNSPYFSDHMVLFFSFSTVLLHLLYARDYLRFWEYFPRIEAFVKGFAIVVLGGVIISFFKGGLYRFAFPFSHAASFVSPLFLLGCVIFYRKKGHPVSIRFLLAFFLLSIGVVLLLLGNIGVIPANAFTVHWLKFGVLGEVIFLSLTMAEKYRQLQVEKEEARKESLEKLKELNQLKDEYNKELEETVAERTSELEQRTEELEIERGKLREVNQNLFSSIRYAERIQSSILPTYKEIAPLFQDHFIFFRPRDIVSGDIYWFASVKGMDEDSSGTVPRTIDHEREPERSDLALFAAIDCTGHGVPGAFLSILAHDILNQTLKEPLINTPGQALDFLDRAVHRTFDREQGNEERMRDGMDMAMCALDRDKMELHFAGAQNPCYLIREGELWDIKGDKRSIGEESPSDASSFSDQKLSLQKGDTLYLFSDGYADQFGGPKGKKFKYKPFKELLCEVHQLDMRQQKRIIEERFDEWKGEHEQVDDVLVMGIRV